MKSKTRKFLNLSFKNLRTKILGIILLCWMIPLVAMGTINTIIYRTSYKDKIDSSVISEVNYAGMLTAEKLEFMMDKLYMANSEQEIETAYKEYINEEITKKRAFKKAEELSER